MVNMFAGGAVERMAIFAPNIMPYISASIIMQLMTSVSRSYDLRTRWHRCLRVDEPGPIVVLAVSQGIANRAGVGAVPRADMPAACTAVEASAATADGVGEHMSRHSMRCPTTIAMPQYLHLDVVPAECAEWTRLRRSSTNAFASAELAKARSGTAVAERLPIQANIKPWLCSTSVKAP
jgi:hypothetical protein